MKFVRARKDPKPLPQHFQIVSLKCWDASGVARRKLNLQSFLFMNFNLLDVKMKPTKGVLAFMRSPHHSCRFGPPRVDCP